MDIGDHVRRGQVLATLETPELDADLAAARAELTAAEAQVKVRAAETEFAKSTNERWRDSPKGVVSDQEHEAKPADYDGAVARLKSKAKGDMRKAYGCPTFRITEIALYFGGRPGYVLGVDPETGDLKWKANMIPGQGEVGYDTWPEGSQEYGGSGPWIVGSYDPRLNMYFTGTANAYEWNPKNRGGGKMDNL